MLFAGLADRRIHQASFEAVCARLPARVATGAARYFVGRAAEVSVPIAVVMM
jgi:hypothetical protein